MAAVDTVKFHVLPTDKERITVSQYKDIVLEHIKPIFDSHGIPEMKCLRQIEITKDDTKTTISPVRYASAFTTDVKPAIILDSLKSEIDGILSPLLEQRVTIHGYKNEWCVASSDEDLIIYHMIYLWK